MMAARGASIALPQARRLIVLHVPEPGSIAFIINDKAQPQDLLE